MRRVAAVVALLAGVAALAGFTWFARTSLRATDPATATSSTPSVGAGTSSAPTSRAADAAANPSESAATRRTEEARSPSVAPSPSDANSHVVTGRVLDERRRPVARCDVTLLRIGGAATHESSDDEGRFICATRWLDAAGSEAASLFALASDGRCALASVDLRRIRGDDAPPADPLDAGDLIVAPGGRLRVRVVGESGPVANVAIEVACGAERLRAPPATSGADGRAEWPAVPAGSVRARAFSSDARAGVADGELAAGSTSELELRLAPTRSVDVRVSDEQGQPIEGAHVAVLERGAFERMSGRGPFVERTERNRELPIAVAPTDAEGRTRIPALPGDVTGWLYASKDGCEMSGSKSYPTWRELPIAVEVTSVQLGLRLPVPIELRWHVRAGAAPVPPDGSTIRLVPVRNSWQRSTPWPDRGVIRDGDLVVASWIVGEALTAWAIAPDDAVALVEDPNYGGSPDTISFAPGRRLTVTIRDAQGHAVRGALVTQLLEDPDEDREFKLSSAQRTDTNGVARFFPLMPTRRAVLAARSADSIPHVRIGFADLTQGDVAIEGTLRTTRGATLAFEIDGERRLPTRYRLRGPIVFRARSEDAARGEAHLELEDSGPPVPMVLRLDAEGFCPCDVTIPAATGTTEPFVVVPLERGGTLVARILASPSAPPRPHLEQFDAATGRFAPLRGSPDWIQSPNGGTDRYEFTTLAPGRYRVADGIGLRSQLGRSYVASDAVDVATGATAYVELDLRRVKSVHVTFTVPEGEDPSLARVVVVGNGPEAPSRSEQGVEWPGIAPNGGSPGVELRVDETRALRVRAWHPWLVPARDGGEAVVDGTRDPVALVLERAPLLTFAVPEGAMPERPAFVAWTPVGGGTGGCAWALQRNGQFRFGPPPIGTWDLQIDCDELAPLRLRNVSFDGTARDLGALAFTRGSSLRIVAADATAPLPPLHVRATARGDLACVRWARTGRDGAPPVVHGLPAGTVDVVVQDADTRELYASETIEVDGVAPHELTLRGR